MGDRTGAVAERDGRAGKKWLIRMPAPGRQRQIFLLLLAAACLGAASGVNETTFNNFLNDTFHLTAEARGRLEFPRELPGFLTAVFSGALFLLVETRIAAVSALAAAIGLFGIAATGDHYAPMFAFMILYSAGTHLLMPLQSSITLSLAEEGKQASLLGDLGGVGTAATILGCGFVWLAVDRLHLHYSAIFAGGAIAALAGAFVMGAMRVPAHPGKRRPFLYRRKYNLFYILNILFGARKQLFITFGPWVLIKVFHEPASIFAKLWILSALIGIFTKPALGRWIDRYGERKVLVADGICLMAVCLGYGYAERLGLGRFTLPFVCACYMLDQALFAVTMARTVYLHKITEQREDLAPTLSLGVTVDHAVSMTVPALGGLLWERCGYPSVFLAGGVVAILTTLAASRIRVEPAAISD